MPFKLAYAYYVSFSRNSNWVRNYQEILVSSGSALSLFYDPSLGKTWVMK